MQNYSSIRKFNQNEKKEGDRGECGFYRMESLIIFQNAAIENPIQTTLMYKMLSTFMPATIIQLIYQSHSKVVV